MGLFSLDAKLLDEFSGVAGIDANLSFEVTQRLTVGHFGGEEGFERSPAVSLVMWLLPGSGS